MALYIVRTRPRKGIIGQPQSFMIVEAANSEDALELAGKENWRFRDLKTFIHPSVALLKLNTIYLEHC